MSALKDVVRRYTEGFRAGDLERVVSCLAPDVVWVVHGDKTLQGRGAFAAAADGAAGPHPELHLDRLIEEGDTVAVVGHGTVVLGSESVDVVYSEVFGFTGGLISRLDTFHIWLRES